MNFKKVMFSSTLGAAIAFGAVTSAFAAEAPETTNTKAPTPIKVSQPAKQAAKKVKVLTQAQAKAIALKVHPGTVKDIQLKKEKGKDAYVVLVQAKNHKQYLVKIDAKSGKILSNTLQKQAKAPVKK